MKKVGYLDENDGHISSFYHTFKEDFEIEIFEIDSETTLEGLVEGILESGVELLVTDYLLDESGEVTFNGDKVIDRILAKRPHFPILMLTSYEGQAIQQMRNVNIINGKDIMDGDHPERVDLLVKKFQANIDNYYKQIEDAERTIEGLVAKRLEAPLSPEEEEILAKNYIFLDEVNPDEKTIPASMILPGEVSRLGEFVANTREILDELKKNSNP